MIKNVTRKVIKAIPTATAMTIPATAPLESRLVEEFADGVWAEDDDAEVLGVEVTTGVAVVEDVVGLGMIRCRSAKERTSSLARKRL